MIHRRRFLAAALALAAIPTAQGQAPAPGKIPRVAYVWLFDVGPSAPYQPAFRQRMAELGWVEGKTVVADYRSAEGSQEKLAAIMKELVDSKVDVIVAMCTPEAIAARKATT